MVTGALDCTRSSIFFRGLVVDVRERAFTSTARESEQ